MPAFSQDPVAVVLEGIIDDFGLFGRRFVVPRVALSTARHYHAFTSSVGALVEVCLAFGCKDCEPIFIFLAGWYDEEIAFF